jgi:ArsR family metal-binding transcriptional regulator
MSDRSQPTDRLIDGYDLELLNILCVPGSPSWNARATLDDDIDEALPYLNAELEGADYHDELKTLIWKDRGRKWAFRPREIGVAPVEDREEARRLVDEMVGRVNAIWQRRAEIEPSYQRRRLPGVMDIYKLLPRTNCKECGYPSCMAYAAALREGKAEPSQCPDLTEEALAAVHGESVQ